MAEVLSLPLQADSRSYFAVPLRRTSSHTNVLVQSSSCYSGSSPDLKSKYTIADYGMRHPTSLPSSAPSSPRPAPPDFSNQTSLLSTPSSSFSLEEQCASEDDDISFPSYDDENGHEDGNGNNARGRPLSRLQTRQPSQTCPELTLPATPLNTPATAPLKAPSHLIVPERSIAGDDTAVSREPTRHVDYLSHNWREEDIWSSWKHVVSRRNVYSNSPRLENASWRTWTKTMYRLKTVSPERLNWMKDHDVTWLYGPLQTGNPRPLVPPPASQVSRSNSFGMKKPILKKRSLSEMMLQRSLSSSTLMKQATDALRAQQPGKRFRERPILHDRGMSDYISSSASTTPSAESVATSASPLPSAGASGRQTPCTKKHIHFNNKVEQCIAINKGLEDHGDLYCAVQDEFSSDDELLTMKPVDHPKASISKAGTPRSSFSNESKTIAMLPSTTLNYRGDTPEPAEQQAKQIASFWNSPSKLKPSPSQETIKPSSTSTNFLLDDEDDELDTNWQPSASRKASTYPLRSEPQHSTYGFEDEERSGLRRTPSGMFMPYDEEDEDHGVTAGLVGKVIDTVNTAKDIAHVIWNVGWRG